MKKGFTLLELLMVVIIVGILASIAIPQFFKVAERARASEGANVLGAVRSAQLRYYSEHGKLTGALTDLDVDTANLKFFAAPGCTASTYAGGTEIIGTIVRNGTSNPGFGGYTLTVYGNGDTKCSGGTKCPAGF